MKTEEILLHSRYDDSLLGASVMIPDIPAKTVFVLVHGMAEHRKRYVEFMTYLCMQGYALVMHDHRGHGDSVKNEKDLGYFYENGEAAMISDVRQMIDYAKTRFPAIPLVLFGHSMGSLVVRNAVKRCDRDVDALIACGSPSRNPLAKSGLLLVKAFKKCFGPYHRSSIIQKLAFGSFAKRFASDKSENAWLCSDHKVVAAYDADPRCGFIFTLNGFETLFQLMIHTYEKDNWSLWHLTMPILFIAGEEDPCIVSKKHFQEAVSFMRQLGYQRVMSKLYPGMRHEILNETKRHSVYEDIVSWVEQSCREQ